MKEILLLRHAKSDWNHNGDDFDRPLSSRGLKDAPAIGELLVRKKLLPDQIIASPAKRAHQTTSLSLEEASLDKSVVFWNEKLYYGTVNDYISSINNASEDLSRIMLVGHNPLIEVTAGILIGAQTRSAIHMATATLVMLESTSESWKNIKLGKCSLKWMISPKLLRSNE